MSHLRPLLTVAGVLALVGCGGPPAADMPALHPTTGTLTRDGKAVGGGALRFHPTGGDANTIVTAEVKADGTFTAHTARGDGQGVARSPGAPAGRYQVTYTPLADGQSGAMAIDLPELVTVEPRENVLKLKLPKK